MARTKKPLEEVVEDVVVTEAEAVIEAADSVEEVEAAETVEAVEELPVETIEVVEEVVPEPVIEVKKKQKKIVLKTGKIAISDFAIPIGIDPIWGDDLVKRVLVEADTTINLELHEAIDLAKWVRYYKSLEVFGVRVLKFGEE